MLECLALRKSAGGSSVLNSKNILTKMTKIKEAAEVSLNIYNEIDSIRLPKEIRIKHNALGQLLRALLSTVENESRRIETTGTSATT